MFKQTLRALALALCVLPLAAGCASRRAAVSADEPAAVRNFTMTAATAAAETAAPASPSETPETLEAAEPTPAQTPEALQPAALDYLAVKPYEAGQIMILMYHGLTEGEETDSYTRSVTHFREDLQALYDRAFRLMSMQDWRDNHVTVAAGFTPVILTFDDGKGSSFSLTDTGGSLQPAENCAVDIMTKFSEAHPDFGNTAIFFVNGNAEPFKGAGTLQDRFAYLLDRGFEIGNHTYSHDSMKKLSAEGIQEEIGRVDQMIRENSSGYIPYAISYPFGIKPQEALESFVLNGLWQDRAYHYDFALCVGQSGAPSVPIRTGYDSLSVPRVRASDNEATDLGWTLRYYEEHPEARYISDGIPDRISVPEEYVDNVDESLLNGKELYVYDKAGNKAR
ncbi:MAG: polysaccharide deacetylase family protein [Clostridiales bacterium]|jgi:peptidoglycan/xylan/chitin deacetylase (PgdA/CDA1 family)|nr:polysaccharide deacetylase family protein [Clostridiales bacterium]